MPLSQVFLVAAGGALGAVLRFAVSKTASTALGDAFPYGTLVANLAGCFLIGLLWSVGAHTGFSDEVRAFVFAGTLGAFTTFSTYSLEAVTLLREGAVGQAAAYVLVSNAAGLALVYLGLTAARVFLARGAS